MKRLLTFLLVTFLTVYSMTWLLAGGKEALIPFLGAVANVPVVQGVSGGTPLPVDGSGVTQPISGTVGSTTTGTPGETFANPGAIPQTQEFPQIWSGSNWYRLGNAALGNNSTGSNILGVGLELRDYAGANYFVQSMADNPAADGQLAANINAAHVTNIGLVERTSGVWDVHRAGGAANLAAQSAVGSALMALPGQWSVQNTPAVTAQATISRAAGAAGVRHVCTSICASVDSSALLAGADNLNVVLRDGATGAGTILWQGLLSLPVTAGAADHLTVTNLNIVGSAATAMTLEFTAGGGATTLESVSMTGYDAS